MLEVRDVVGGYGRLRVLRGVSMDVSHGEIVAVLGANGAGKTTLMRTIAGLMAPSSGTITFAGEAVAGWRPDKLASRGLVLVPEGKRIFPSLTVEECLDVAGRMHGRTRGAAGFGWILEFLPRLAERRAQLAGTLSGGERQMLALAMGLLARPRLLVLDEPSHGLAPSIVAEVFAKVAEIAQEQGLSVIVVEQLVVQALEIASRAYLMSKGEIVRAGAAEEMLSDEAVRSHYLGAGRVAEARSAGS